MTRRAGRRVRVAIALMFVACFAAAAVEPFLVHTDDGCAVEVHCLACRWAQSTTAVFLAAPRLPLVVKAAETVSPRSEQLVVETAVEALPSRGPPAR